MPDFTNLDPQVVSLAKAIRQTESGGDFNAIGDQGTSKGAYQFHNDHFEKWATQYGLDPKDFSPVNQDKVAYARMKDLKDQGYHAGEIAAMWNGSHLENGRPVANHPDYITKVQKNLGATQSTNQTFNPKPFSSGAVELPDVNLNKSPLGVNADGSNQVVDDSPFHSLMGFGKGLIEPELKGLATGARAVQAAVQNGGQIYKDITAPGAFQGQTFRSLMGPTTPGSALNKAEQTMAKPLLGQKTLGGSSVQENMGSATTAGLQGLGLKMLGFKSSIPEVMNTGLMQSVLKGGGQMGNLIRLVALEKLGEKIPSWGKTLLKHGIHP